MAKKPVKLVLRSKPIIMVVVLLAMICATVAVVAMQNALEESKAQYEMRRLQAAALENANDELGQDIAGLGSVESMIEIAEEELGLVLPGTVIFTPGN